MSITADFTAAFPKSEMASMMREYDAQGFYACFRATHVVDEASGNSYARSKSRECRQAACFNFDKAIQDRALRQALRA